MIPAAFEMKGWGRRREKKKYKVIAKARIQNKKFNILGNIPSLANSQMRKLCPLIQADIRELALLAFSKLASSEFAVNI